MKTYWTDADERLLHVSFAILGDVIEKEKILEHVEEEGDPNDGESWAWALREMRQLWAWWTVTRPERDAEADRRLMAWHALYKRDRDNYTAANPDWRKTDNPKLQLLSPKEKFETDETRAAWALNNEYSDEVRGAEDDEMLRRLIGVRRYLWT